MFVGSAGGRSTVPPPPKKKKIEQILTELGRAFGQTFLYSFNLFFPYRFVCVCEMLTCWMSLYPTPIPE